MKKIVIAPDSFKGTLSAAEVCRLIADAAHRVFPDCETVCVPLADGGEGTVDALTGALGGRIEKVPCKGPFMEDIIGSFGIIGDTAFVEIASACGLPMVLGRENPLCATTYGFGELILSAAESGAKKITLCLGGSCTNDFACGAASAVGVRFFDRNGNSFIPTGGTLCEIDAIDLSGINPLLKDIQFTAMCDITNPVFGPYGAAYVFAPQKGASDDDVVLLDDGLRNICRIILRDHSIDLSALRGGGAAGGAGAGAAFFFGSSLISGAQAVLEAADFAKLIDGADLVVTGEGRLDSQSFGGKAVGVVSSQTSKQGVALIAIAGGVDIDSQTLSKHGITAAFSVNRLPLPFEQAALSAKENLAYTAENVFKLYALGLTK